MSEQELTDRDNDMLELLEWVRTTMYGISWWTENLTDAELLKRYKNRSK